MEDHREKDKRVEEDAMRRFFSSQPTGFICPILNGPCSTMTEAEEIEAELHTRIKEQAAQLKAAEEVIELCKTNLVSIASMTVFDGGTEESYGICYDHAVETAEHTLERIGTYRNTYGEVE